MTIVDAKDCRAAGSLTVDVVGMNTQTDTGAFSAKVKADVDVPSLKGLVRTVKLTCEYAQKSVYRFKVDYDGAQAVSTARTFTTKKVLISGNIASGSINVPRGYSCYLFEATDATPCILGGTGIVDALSMNYLCEKADGSTEYEVANLGIVAVGTSFSFNSKIYRLHTAYIVELYEKTANKINFTLTPYNTSALEYGDNYVQVLVRSLDIVRVINNCIRFHLRML